MKKFLSISLVAMLFAAILSSCNGNDPTPPNDNQGDTIQVQAIESDKEILLFVDSTYKINVTITPENANEPLVWNSDNEKVATVNNEGVVTAIAAGECNVSVSAGSLTSTTKVTVIKNPVTLELKLQSVESNKCTINVKPSNEKGYYYCSYAKPKDIEGLSDAEIIDNLFSYALAYADQLAVYGKTLTDILHFGSKSLHIRGLMANTEYVILAFGINAEHKMASTQLARLSFTTPAIEMSDMTIEIRYDSTFVEVSGNTKKTKLCFTAIPSNDDPYVFKGAVNFDEKYASAQEYLEYTEREYAAKGGVEMLVKTGVSNVYGVNPTDGDVYTLIAAGYRGGWSTEPFVFKYEYKEATANMPARLVPYQETSDNSDKFNPLEIRPFIRKASY